ncbi:MAG: DnaJ domain-containing protein [bacterium]
MKDYYSILEIEQNAGETLIKSQYRKLASVYHPDKNPDNQSKFLDLNEAYKTLMNPALRELHDKGLREYHNFRKIQSEEHITPYKTRLRDGGNVNIEIDFTDEIISRKKEEDNKFVTKTVKLQRYIKCGGCGGEGKEKGTLATVCPQCRGLGTVKNHNTNINETCQNCNGYGDIFLYKCKICGGMARIKTAEEINLDFNVYEIINDNGNAASNNSRGNNNHNRTIVFKSKGDAGVFGGKDGNLIVSVKIDEDILKKTNNRSNGFFRKLLFPKN